MLDYLFAGVFIALAAGYLFWHYRSSRRGACDKCGDAGQHS
jgi:hypothetical protein